MEGKSTQKNIVHENGCTQTSYFAKAHPLGRTKKIQQNLSLRIQVPSEKVGLGWVWRVQIPFEEILGSLGSVKYSVHWQNTGPRHFRVVSSSSSHFLGLRRLAVKPEEENTTKTRPCRDPVVPPQVRYDCHPSWHSSPTGYDWNPWGRKLHCVVSVRSPSSRSPKGSRAG